MKVIEPQFTKVADGLAGAEGPVFDTNGKFFAVAPMEEAAADRKKGEFIDGTAGKLYSVNLESGEVKEECTPQFDGYGGRPAGCQSDKDGAIWIADMRLGLLKWKDESVTQISKVDKDGNPLNGANDLVFDEEGNLWFTGPGSPIAPVEEDRIHIFKEPLGKIYCLPRGETIPIKVDDNFIFCNGIAVKNKILLIAETIPSKIIAYDIVGPGKVKNRRVWAEVPKEKQVIGGPDGMDFDCEDNLLVANHGQGHIEIYGQDGGMEPKLRIKCPFSTPSNVHFKPGTKTCYVTEHENNAVWFFEWENVGKPMYCNS